MQTLWHAAVHGSRIDPGPLKSEDGLFSNARRAQKYEGTRLRLIVVIVIDIRT